GAHLVAVEGDAAGVGLEDAGHAVEERRLPRAVGPDEPDDLAGVDPQRGVVQGGHPAEADGDVLDLEERRPGARHRCPPVRTGRAAGAGAPAVCPLADTRSISAGVSDARFAARWRRRWRIFCWVSVTIPSGVTISWTMSSPPVMRLNHCDDTPRWRRISGPNTRNSPPAAAEATEFTPMTVATAATPSEWMRS